MTLKNPENGLTLAELVVAATLLAFVVMGSVTALSAGLGYTRHARMTTLTGQITQSAMEQLRLSNYSAISAYAAQSQPVNLDSIISSDSFSSNYTTGIHVNAAFTTLVASSTGVLGKIRVVVTVTWPENNVTYTRKTATIFSEKGMSDYIYAGWSNI